MAYMRSEEHVQAVFRKLRQNETCQSSLIGYPETWDSVKVLIDKQTRMREIYTIEARYLQKHPDSGYLTEILPLTAFPDYLPNITNTDEDSISVSEAEYLLFVEKTASAIADTIFSAKISI